MHEALSKVDVAQNSLKSDLVSARRFILSRPLPLNCWSAFEIKPPFKRQPKSTDEGPELAALGQLGAWWRVDSSTNRRERALDEDGSEASAPLRKHGRLVRAVARSAGGRCRRRGRCMK
jgi:hypothetical protein